MTVPGAHMAAEMAEQPAVLGALAARFDEIAAAVSRALPGRPAGVAFLARGSSDNAALLGRYAVELATGLPTSLVAPSVLTAFGRQPQGFAGWLVVALSQSGETPEIVDLAGRYRAAGATVVAITNDPGSALAAAANVTVALEAGREIAVPATKTVTAQLLATLAVGAALGGERVVPDLVRLPDRVAAVLADVAPVEQVAARLAGSRRLAVVARGLCYPAARETALKLQETTGMMAHAFSTADFRHGPIAVCGPDAPALLLTGGGPADADTRALAAELAQRAATVVSVGSAGVEDIGWPAGDGATDCLLATVRGQQLALALCARLGVDPDSPAGLRKVTPTY
jgi:glucosamine--fructose-6-phosphate aminotransferase (isomerizing)